MFYFFYFELFFNENSNSVTNLIVVYIAQICKKKKGKASLNFDFIVLLFDSMHA